MTRETRVEPGRTINVFIVIATVAGVVGATFGLRFVSALLQAPAGPSSPRWRAIAVSPLSPRSDHVAVWTGKEMLVVGGCSKYIGDETFERRDYRDAAAYDPDADRWRRLPDLPLQAAGPHIWTGRELVVWPEAGCDEDFNTDAPGAALNPESGTWRRLAAVPAGFSVGQVTWAGDRALVVAGKRMSEDEYDHALFEYDVPADRWLPVLPPAGVSAHDIISEHEDVWGGREWLWVGGGVPYGPLKGFGYDPRTRLWRTLPSGPSVIQDALVPNGDELIVWGEPLPRPERHGDQTSSCGSDSDSWEDVWNPSGARYNSNTDRWSAINPGPTQVRLGPWVFDGGDEMLVWGGALDDCISERGDGLAYDYARDTWRELPTSPFHDRVHATAVWTGRELIVWGGGTRPPGEWNSEPANDGAALDLRAT